MELDSHEALLDLDALSGLSEVRVEIKEGNKVKYFAKFGVLVEPTLGKVDVPARLITLVPRFVVANDSQENIIVRQCHLEVCSESLDHFLFICLSDYLTCINTLLHKG